MLVRIESLLSGVETAAGTVVIIDVFRAFTTACLAFRQGAEKIVLFESVDEARAFASGRANHILVGEVGGVMPKGFDFSNSPQDVAGVDFSGKTLVQSTRAGTTGVARVEPHSEVLVASLQNAGATANYLLTRLPEQVCIVAMGWGGRVRTEEDELCALYIRNLLQGCKLPAEAIRGIILASKEAQKFGDPRTPQFSRGDLEHCLDIDATRFAIRVEREQLGRWHVPVARPVVSAP